MLAFGFGRYVEWGSWSSLKMIILNGPRQILHSVVEVILVVSRPSFYWIWSYITPRLFLKIDSLYTLSTGLCVAFIPQPLTISSNEYSNKAPSTQIVENARSECYRMVVEGSPDSLINGDGSPGRITLVRDVAGSIAGRLHTNGSMTLI